MGSKVTLDGSLMFPSDYVAAVEFKGKDWTLTINSVKVEQLVMVGGAKKTKPVISFSETKKKLVLNKTNADSIASMYGAEASKWVGKRITLYPAKALFGNQTVDAIRIREKEPPPKGKGKAPAAPPEPSEPAQPPQPQELDADALYETLCVEIDKLGVQSEQRAIEGIKAEINQLSSVLGDRAGILLRRLERQLEEEE